MLTNPSASEMEKAEVQAELAPSAQTLNITRSVSEGNADPQVRAVRRTIEWLVEKLGGATDRNKPPQAAARAFGEQLQTYIGSSHSLRSIGAEQSAATAKLISAWPVRSATAAVGGVRRAAYWPRHP